MPAARAERAKRREPKCAIQSEPSSLAAIKTPISQEPSINYFREARTHSAWLPEPVPVDSCARLRIGVSRLQCQRLALPIRFSSHSRRQGAPQQLWRRQCRQNHGRSCNSYHRLGPEFHEHLPRAFPQAGCPSYFVGNKPLIEENAFRTVHLQAANTYSAARALGLDCGPMSVSTPKN